MGAVASTIVGYLMALILSVMMARRHYPLPLPFMAAAKIGVACAIMAVCVTALPLSGYEPGLMTLCIKGSVGALSYAVTGYLINAANCRTLIDDGISRLRRRPVIEAAK